MFIQIVTGLVFLFLLSTTLLSVFSGAPMVYTNKKKLEIILKLCGSVKAKKIVDLGSGDGRIVIELAKMGVNAKGIEIDPLLVLISRIIAKFKGVSKNCSFSLGSFWNMDLSFYDGVVVYGIKHIMPRLEKKLEKELKKGSFVISNAYKFPNWKEIDSEGGVYLYKMGF